ncbi:MAG: nucleotidyltransferase domain-containing protein [Lachnospiraceae bacterium]|nr:nucleotidyltransferase domain-containing protein [Lachnospiraceae bacterium]
MNLKSLRKEKKLTQKQVAELVGISLRSYKSYENEESKKNTIKYNYIFEKLSSVNPIDEEHGILELEEIVEKCRNVFEQYDIEYCYLFGSYAKKKAKPTSDIDLLISANIKGLKYFELIEKIREALNKKIDALDINQVKDNFELVQEILKDGIKIYG